MNIHDAYDVVEREHTRKGILSSLKDNRERLGFLHKRIEIYTQEIESLVYLTNILEGNEKKLPTKEDVVEAKRVIEEYQSLVKEINALRKRKKRYANKK